MPKLDGAVETVNVHDVIADGLFNDFEFIDIEFTFNYDSTGPSVEVTDGAVYVLQDNGLMRTAPRGTISLSDNTTNYIYAGLEDASAAVYADTDDSGPYWPSVKVGEVDTSADSTSTVVAGSQPKIDAGQGNIDSLSHDGVYNIIEYGAIDDGATDSYDAVQSAIDDASGGGVVYIPVGDFYIDSSLDPVGNVTICGEDMYESRLLVGDLGADNAALFQNTDSSLSNVIYRNFTVNGENGWSSSAYDPDQKAFYHDFPTNINFDHVHVNDTAATAIGVDNAYWDIYRSCHIENAGTAGEPTGSNGIGVGCGEEARNPTFIIDCEIENTSQHAITYEEVEAGGWTRGMFAIGNHIDGCRVGMSAESASDCGFAFNTVENYDDKGLWLGDFTGGEGARRCWSFCDTFRQTGSLTDADIYINSSASDCRIWDPTYFNSVTVNSPSTRWNGIIGGGGIDGVDLSAVSPDVGTFGVSDGTSNTAGNLYRYDGSSWNTIA